MTIGASLFLIAVGAILKYAVTADIVGIDLQTTGLILMLIGVLGLVLGLYLWNASRSDGTPRTTSEGSPRTRSQGAPPPSAT
jgi:Domain of unknown function (DUF6458)